MRPLLRRLIAAILALAALGVLGTVAALYLVPRETVLATAFERLEQTAGLNVELQGRAEPVLWPIPGWQLGAVRLNRADTGQTLLTAEQALLTINPRGLLHGTLNVGALWLDDATLDVTRNGDGLDLPGFPADAPRVGYLRLRNATLTLRDAGGAEPERFEADFAALDYAGRKEPLGIAVSGQWRGRQVDGRATFTTPDRAIRGDWVFAEIDTSIDADTLRFQGRFRPDFTDPIPILTGNIEAEIANPAGALSWLAELPPDPTLVQLRDVTAEGRIETVPDRLLLRLNTAGSWRDTRVSLDASLRGGAAWRDTGTGTLSAVSRAGGLYSTYLEGSFAREQGVSGDLSLSVLDVPGMTAAGMLPEALPTGDARTASLKGRLSATTDGIALADAALRLDQRNYAGDAALDLRGERPVISLGTDLDRLDLDPWLEPVLTGTRPLVQIQSGLDADLVLELTADQMHLRGVETGPASFAFTTGPDALSLDLRRLDLFGGTVAGTLESRPGERRIAGQLNGAEISLDRALPPFGLSGMSGILSGTATGEIPVNLLERSLHGIAGEAELQLFQGRIDDVDLSRATAGPGQATPFSRLDLTLNAADREISAEAIRLTTGAGSLTGQGTVDLQSRIIGFSLAREAPATGSVTLAGTLDLPEIRTTAGPAAAAAPTQPAPPEQAPDPAVRQVAQTAPAPEPQAQAPETPAPLPAAEPPAEPEPLVEAEADPTAPETAPLPPARR